MNHTATLLSGQIWIQNDLLTIYAKCNNDFKKTLNNYKIGTHKIIISKHTKPSLFKNGEIKLQCNTYNYVLSYQKKEQANIDRITKIINSGTVSNSQVKVFQGSNGIIELHANHIVIKRNDAKLSNLLVHGFKGDKDISLSSITAIQLKTSPTNSKSNPLADNGYIQFSLLGGVESRFGFFDALQDENTVTFKNFSAESFKELKKFIQIKQGIIKPDAPSKKVVNNKNALKPEDLRSQFVTQLKNIAMINEGQVQAPSKVPKDCTASKKDINSNHNEISNQIELLEKLGELRDKNYISEEEFNYKKKEILGF